MKNLLTLLVMVLFTVATLSSCGDDAKTTAKTTTTPPVKQEVKKPEPAPEATASADGEAVYNKACHVCHKAGVAGAAATEGETLDKKRWETMAAKGMPTLKEHAIAGFTGDFGAMPAKGTCMDCTDEQIEAAIKFMFNKVGVAVK